MGDPWYRSRILATGILVLLAIILLCSVPVTAEDISVSVEGPGISNWALIPGITNIDSTNISLNISSFSSKWTVSVVDNLDFSKPPGTAGRMAESDSNGIYTGTNALGTPLTIAGPTVGSKTTGASVALSGSNRIIESGQAPVTGLLLHLNISQPVALSDPHLTGGHKYQVIVTFVAFAEAPPSPIVTGIVPSEGITGSTVTITGLSGSNFQPNAVAVLNRTGSPNINLLATTITPTIMTGTFNLAGAGVGLWDVTVTNPDGRIGTKPRLFWVKYPSAPVIGFLTPISGARGTTKSLLVSGTGFQNGAVVNFTSGAAIMTATTSQVTPTKIYASLTIPSNAPTGSWSLVVTNNDGQSATRSGAFTVTG